MKSLTVLIYLCLILPFLLFKIHLVPLAIQQINYYEIQQVQQAEISSEVLQRIQAEPAKCQPVIIWFKPELIETALTSQQAITTQAVQAFVSSPIRQAIKSVQQVNVEPLVATRKLTNVYHFKNLPGSAGCIYKEGLEELKTKHVRIESDVSFDLKIAESLELIHARHAQERQVHGQAITGKSVNLALIDSGIDYRHNDLGSCFGSGCKVKKGWNALARNEEILDQNGHGTHLAGILASAAPEASLFALKACEKSCSASAVLASIDWCLENDCNIIILSLGDNQGHSPEECAKIQTLKPALENAYKSNILIFAASGNEAQAWPSYPACDPNVISVGSVDDLSDEISFFSNSHPDLLAPGSVITSTWPNQTYKSMAGTSQATAFAGATAALYLQAFKAVNNRFPTTEEVKAALQTSGKPVYDFKTEASYSRIDALNLILEFEAVCGNGVCEFDESLENCPADCHKCGDGICTETYENTLNCPIDCKGVCGNGVCESNETSTCPQDCGNVNLTINFKDWHERPLKTEFKIYSGTQKLIEANASNATLQLPKGFYKLELKHKEFSSSFYFLLQEPLELELKIEDVTVLAQQPPPGFKIIKAYAFGSNLNTSATVCFESTVEEANAFVFSCPWANKCFDNWKVVSSLRRKTCFETKPNIAIAIATSVSFEESKEFKPKLVKKPKKFLLPLVLALFGMVAMFFLIKKRSAKAKYRALMAKVRQELLKAPPKPPENKT